MDTDERDVSPDSDNEYDRDDDDTMADSNIAESLDPNGEVKKKYDPKDPMRPRRKKARRACFACQRAHLTCGMPHSHSSYQLSYMHDCQAFDTRTSHLRACVPIHNTLCRMLDTTAHLHTIPLGQS